MSKKISPTEKAAEFIKNSQKKMSSLREKLLKLSKKEKRLEKESEKALRKMEGKDIQEVKISISISSVVKATIAILLLIGLVGVLNIIQGTVIIFLVALFLSATLNPAVDKLHTRRIPRALGIILIYIVIIGIFVVMFSNLIPIIVDQIEQIASSLRDMVLNLVNGNYSDSWIVQSFQPYIDQIWQQVDQDQVVSQLSGGLLDVATNLKGFAQNALGAIFAVFNGIFNLALVLIITFYMVVHSQHTSDFFYSLFPHRYSAYLNLKAKQVSTRIGEWVRGQVLLALAMGILTFIIFSVIGIDYALTLSLVSALAEFIPYFGPIITFASAALIALNQDPVLFLWLIPAYAILQFVEGNILVPLIVGRSVGLNPVVVIFALLAGAGLGYNLGGGVGLAIVGMIIAVPTANIISLFVEDYTGKNK